MTNRTTAPQAASATASDATSATSATSMDSHMNNTSKSSPDACAPCRAMLQQILQQTDSRPRALLESMMLLTPSRQHQSHNQTLYWRETSDGRFQVPIPVERTTPRRRWTQLPPQVNHQHDENSNNNDSNNNNNNPSSSPFRQPLEQFWWQATSSRWYDNNNKKNNNDEAIATTTTTTTTTTSVPPSPKESVVPPTTIEIQNAKAGATQNNNRNTLQNEEKTQTMEWMNVSCQICPNSGVAGNARGYVSGPNPLEVIICANHLSHLQHYTRMQNSSLRTSKTLLEQARAAADREMTELLTHELVHVYDVRQLHLDLRDCETLAYSEIRAARQADCVDKSPWTKQACVHAQAKLATTSLFASTRAQQCVRKVWEAAYADQQPTGNGTSASTNGTTAPSAKRVNTQHSSSRAAASSR